MGPISNDGNTKNISIYPIENGYQVSVSQSTKKLSADGNNYLHDYSNITFALDTVEEATAKAAELLKN